MVSAKSGTSFERKTSSRSGITLFEMLSAAEQQLHGSPKNRPDEPNKQPDEPKRPPNGVVASNALPVEDEVERELLASNKRSKKDQNNGGDIISKL